MIKQITVTFDFDTETENVSNVKVVNNIEKKKTTTKKLSDLKNDDNPEVIILESNKLILGSEVAEKLQVEYGSRVIIKWVKEGNKMIPVIGSDLAFDEEGAGNKLTKTNTISYRGKANDVLAELGNEFALVEYKDDIFKLIPKGKIVKDEEESIEELVEEAIQVEPELIVDDEEETEIDELQFKL